MSERIDVMISSTAHDLPDYRQQALDACVRQGMFPIMMEHLPAMASDAITVSLAMVEEAEIYLGIFARRYGYVPDGHEISITEMEYNRARERDIPCLIFLMDDDHDYDPGPPERPELQERLKVFHNRLKRENVVNFFTSPDNFRAQVINSLSQHRQPDLTALHRLSTAAIPSPPDPYIAHPYTLLDTRGLFGRKSELQLLTDWLANPYHEIYQSRVVSLIAIGGMGKSALSWKWFNEVAPQHVKLAGRMWWSFYEADARYESFITRALAYVTDVPEKTVQKLNVAQREDKLLSTLDRQPFLLVLDGLERLLMAYVYPNASRKVDNLLDTQSIPVIGGMLDTRLRKAYDPRASAFLGKLASVRASRILISTRLHPVELETPTGDTRPGAYVLHLHGLDHEDALELWRSFGVTGSKEALKKLFSSFDNYPLLIRALAGEVARYRRAPGDFNRWKRSNRDFSPFQLPMVQRQSHVLQFALAGLDEKQLQVLRTIAAFSSPSSYDTLADVLVGEMNIFTSEHALDEALSELEDRGVLGWDRDANRYDLHPVVRGVVWGSLPQDEKKIIYEKLHAHFDALPSIENWREIHSHSDLNAPLELFHTLMGLERYDEACEVFQRRLYRPLRYRLSDGQMLATLLEQFFPEGTDYAPRLKQLSDQAWTLNALAQAYQMIGQPGRAVPFFRRSNHLKERASYTVDLSGGWRDLSYALRLCGSLREAEAAARQALVIDRREDNRLLEAISLQVLGLALAVRGNFTDSAIALDRSLDLADRTNANRAYNHQSIRSIWSGDFEAGSDWAQKGMLYCRRRGLEAGLILSKRLQGQAALGLGDIEKAEKFLHDALLHARSVKLVEEELAALVVLAELRRQQMDLQLARELLADVWAAAEEGPYPLIHADACNVLAHIERNALEFPIGILTKAEKDKYHSAAVAAAEKAYRLAWCDGIPYAYHAGLERARTQLNILNAPEPEMPVFDESATVPLVLVEINPT